VEHAASQNVLIIIAMSDFQPILRPPRHQSGTQDGKKALKSIDFVPQVLLIVVKP
jgi:hypothetical protein